MPICVEKTLYFHNFHRFIAERFYFDTLLCSFVFSHKGRRGDAGRNFFFDKCRKPILRRQQYFKTLFILDAAVFCASGNEQSYR